jgi:hypothetical protein
MSFLKAMAMSEKRVSQKRKLLIAAAVLVGMLISFFTIAGFILEPLLKKRLHTLIINGSDSLYRYSLGSLHADLFGANVKVEDLKIWVDSNRFRQMRMERSLPPLTMNLDMKEGRIRGISLLAILIGKKLKIRKIDTQEGQLTLLRHFAKPDTEGQHEKQPSKATKPALNGISIGEIKLENIRFAYWDLGQEDVQLQFRRCDALLQDIRVDSAMLADTTRLGYLGHLSFQLQELDYLSADSVYKLNVGSIRYSSDNRQLSVDQFRLQPSDTAGRLLQLDTVGKAYFSVQTENIRFQNMRLEQFINANTIRADSVVLQSPVVSVFLDRTLPKNMRSKVGNFPHQLIAKAPMTLSVKNLLVPRMQLTYTEKSDKTGKEGRVDIRDVTIHAENVTNEPGAIKSDPVCTIRAAGKILGSSPVTARFHLYLDAEDGRFDMEGAVKNISATQLNPLAESLASIRIQSLNIDEVLFSIKAVNDSATGNIRMRYSGLALQVLKTDKQSGDTEVNRFLSKLLNRYMTHPSNPGPDGIERTEGAAHVSRLLSHSFFGLIWKTIFTGMQNIMLKT